MEANHTPEGMRRAAERLAHRVRNRPAFVRSASPVAENKNEVQILSRPSPSPLPIPRKSRQPQVLLKSLLQLPPELQLLILKCLSFGDIQHLRQTCHFFRNCINKAVIRSLFPDLKEELLMTCYHCLERQADKGMLVRGEETDARYPLASRCFTCVAQRSGFTVGRKYMLDNSVSVWVCRWCGYPVSTFPVFNQPQFHSNCFRNYNRVLLLYFMLGCAQWVIVIVGASLCWRYFRYYKLILGSTLINFILSLWVFGLSVLRGATLRTYHWALILEVAILALWALTAYRILWLVSRSPKHPSKSTIATLAFIGVNLLFRLLNVAGNLILVLEWKMWRRNKPETPRLQRLVNCFLLFLVFWTDPQSMEQEYPATWWFKRWGRQRPIENEDEV